MSAIIVVTRCPLSCLVERLANAGRKGHPLQLMRQPHVIIEEEVNSNSITDSSSQSVSNSGLSGLSVPDSAGTQSSVPGNEHPQPTGEPGLHIVRCVTLSSRSFLLHCLHLNPFLHGCDCFRLRSCYTVFLPWQIFFLLQRNNVW